MPFFSLPLGTKNQEYFAFEWYDPERGISRQLIWTCLPQGYNNFPTIFDETLHEYLVEYQANNPDVTLPQYVHDLLIEAESKESCHEGI
jgi:predicted AlkP superfamily pyrophosphatase or phosphodiesterase